MMTTRPKRAKPPAQPPHVIADHGLTHRWGRGEVDVESAPDPENIRRTINRPRRHDPVHALKVSGRLGQAEWLAAERFRDLHDMAEGLRLYESVGGRAPWQRAEYLGAQLDAVRARAAAIQAVGIRLSAVFLGATLSCTPLRALERDLHIRSGTAADLLVEAMTLLVGHFARADQLALDPGDRYG